MHQRMGGNCKVHYILKELLQAPNPDLHQPSSTDDNSCSRFTVAWDQNDAQAGLILQGVLQSLSG